MSQEVSKGKNRSVWIKAGVTVAVVIALFVVMQTLPVESWLKQFNAWVADLGAVGYVVFFVAYAAAVVAFLPGSVLTIGAGVVFGLWKGFLMVSFASTTGAALAFLIARTGGRNWVRTKLEGSSKFATIDSAVGRKGGRIVAMLRLSPVIPFNLLNYGLGITAVRFWPYVLASWIGMMPGTLLYVYIGYLTRESVTAAATDADPNTLRFVYMGIGLIATVIVTVYLTKLARKSLQEETQLEGDS